MNRDDAPGAGSRPESPQRSNNRTLSPSHTWWSVQPSREAATNCGASPASTAHSMDTSWFGVDAQGALPLRAGNLGGPSKPSFDALVFHAAILAKSRGPRGKGAKLFQ